MLTHSLTLIFQAHSSTQNSNGRDHRNVDRPLYTVPSQEPSGHRADGRPPSGRLGRPDRPSMPSNFDSLPPRLKKKYEEDRLLALQSMGNNDRIPSVQVAPSHSSRAKQPTDDETLRTFLNATGVSAQRPVLPHPFANPAPANGPSSIRPQQWNTGGKPVRGARAPATAPRTRSFQSDQEDTDGSYARPRSQDSMSGGFHDPSRERKTSATDSRSSTPSSSLELASGQNPLRGIQCLFITLT